MAVRYYTDGCTYRLPSKRLTASWLSEVAQSEGYTLGEVNYIFCSAARLLEMNRQYLGHDYYTDVITFDYSDRRHTRVISGDVFIDVETVADNARLYGSSRLEEMRRVVVHGVLHLCGQQDKTPRTNAQMHRKEDKYLAFWQSVEAPTTTPKTSKTSKTPGTPKIFATVETPAQAGVSVSVDSSETGVDMQSATPSTSASGSGSDSYSGSAGCDSGHRAL